MESLFFREICFYTPLCTHLIFEQLRYIADIICGMGSKVAIKSEDHRIKAGQDSNKDQSTFQTATCTGQLLLE